VTGNILTGKSTLVGLLEQFYKPRAGEVIVDGAEVTTYPREWLRSHMGIVSQVRNKRNCRLVMQAL
jgi:ATP-binding cassette subfamily B protein